MWPKCTCVDSHGCLYSNNNCYGVLELVEQKVTHKLNSLLTKDHSREEVHEVLV